MDDLELKIVEVESKKEESWSDVMTRLQLLNDKLDDFLQKLISEK